MDSTGTSREVCPAGPVRSRRRQEVDEVGGQLPDDIIGRIIIQFTVERAVEHEKPPVDQEKDQAGHVVEVGILKDRKPGHDRAVRRSRRRGGSLA